MTLNGLPQLDVPAYIRDPHDCRKCKHSFYEAGNIEPRSLICGRQHYTIRCLYERHETGDCKPEALFFKQRGVE